jgi:hypothetical protein
MTEFEILAEVSIGLVGFAGVVVALGRSELSSSTQNFHLTMLFANGVAALWGSLSPTIARLVLGAESSYIVLACAMYLPAFVVVNIYAFRVVFNFYAKSKAISLTLVYSVIFMCASSFTYMVAAMIAFPAQIAASMYISVSLLLFLGISHFYDLVKAIPWRGRDDA